MPVFTGLHTLVAVDALVRLDDPELGPGTQLEVECVDGETRSAELCETPMYDKKRLIPRGKLVEIKRFNAISETMPDDIARAFEYADDDDHWAKTD